MPAVATGPLARKPGILSSLGSISLPVSDPALGAAAPRAPAAAIAATAADATSARRTASARRRACRHPPPVDPRNGIPDAEDTIAAYFQRRCSAIADAYVNVHTAKNPGGEIRGLIRVR